MRFRASFVLAALMLLTGICSTAQQIAPDATAPGPLPVAVGSYDMGAQVDNLVLPNCQPRSGYDCKIDVKAEVYRPQTLSGTYPLVIFLHGNHGTCGRPYQSPPDPPGMLGNPRIDDSVQLHRNRHCPSNYVESPSYIGYDYLAQSLGELRLHCGFDRCEPRYHRRSRPGRRQRAHQGARNPGDAASAEPEPLEPTWRRRRLGVGANLQGHLDFTNVGMMGHSRGGDGVRAAYNDYIDAGSIWPGMIEDPVTFKGVFEIAPVDFLGNNSKGVAWNIIAGMCDGDVFDLEGIPPYDRDILPPFESPQYAEIDVPCLGRQSQLLQHPVAGQRRYRSADRRIFPTSAPAAGMSLYFTMSPGSPQQRLTSMSSLLAFFRANVGTAVDTDFNRNFNPWWGIPRTVTDENGVAQPYPARADRGYTPPSPIKVFEDFTEPTGTSSYGFPNLASNITISHGRVPEHDTTLKAGVISWTSAGQNTYFQTRLDGRGHGLRHLQLHHAGTASFAPEQQPKRKLSDRPVDSGGRCQRRNRLAQAEPLHRPQLRWTVRTPVAPAGTGGDPRRVAFDTSNCAHSVSRLPRLGTR